MREAGVAVGRRDGVPLLTVRGEHDVSNEQVLRDGLAAALAHGAAVVVDLSEASFIDSSVLHALAGVSCPGRGEIVVCARSDGLTRRLLEIAGLHEVVQVAETVEDALGFAAAEPAR